jgi:hypothetical protein
MTKNQLIEIFGWYGAGAIILAYALVSFSILAATDTWYQVLNGTGALGIIAISLKDKAYQPAVLNILWATIAFFALVKIAL